MGRPRHRSLRRLGRNLHHSPRLRLGQGRTFAWTWGIWAPWGEHPTMLCMWLLHPGIPTASILYILIHWWILSMFLLVSCRPPIFSHSFSQQIGTSDHTGLINSQAFWALSMAQEISPAKHHTFPSFLGLWNWRFLVTSLLVANPVGMSILSLRDF